MKIPVNTVSSQIRADGDPGTIQVQIKLVLWMTKDPTSGVGKTSEMITVPFAPPPSMVLQNGMSLSLLTENSRLMMDYLHNVLFPTLVVENVTSFVSTQAGAGDECKIWVQTILMRAIFGADIPVIPNTGNNDAEWNIIFDDSQVAQGDVNWLGKIDPSQLGTDAANAVRTFFENAQAGDMVQTEMTYKSGATGPHTFVFDKISGDGIWVFDSNWQFDHTVRYHFISFASMSKWISLNLYQLK
jgi:hypothetical protein